uniref:Uncharacterized protein n=1 Tax=Arundo donax TaxID=35708 RepID=A0A0A9DC48_ARUDO
MNTQDDFWSSIVPSRYHIRLILLIICSATKINHLDSTRLGQSLVIGALLWGSGRNLDLLWSYLPSCSSMPISIIAASLYFLMPLMILIATISFLSLSQHSNT